MHIIDFHSHILPGIDDGSKDIEMSRQMLTASHKQHIDTMVATPHFYADRMSIDAFLHRREYAYQSIIDDADDEEIYLIKGAEVAFFSGMSHAERLEELRIGDTNLILIEMPFREWTDRDIKEIWQIRQRGLQPIMAHLERFYPYQKKNDMIESLLEQPVYVQINAESLFDFWGKRKALKLFKEGDAHLLGSDCHNTKDRIQNLAKAREVLAKKLGSGILHEIDGLGADLLTMD